MDWGEHFDKLKAMQAQGIQVPALERMPEVPVHAAFIARAFMDLGGERSAAGQLRWSAVMRWAHAVGADGFALWDALVIVDAEVRKWLDHHHASRQSKLAPPLNATR